MAFQETSRSPLNNSKFKQLYSFPKANRFTAQGFISKAPYYDNKITALNQRATSFGYGNKYTLENKNPFPPPNNYNKSGLFEANITKRVGYSFSHDKKKGLVEEEVVRAIPGPGKYNFLHDKTDFKRVSYSLRGKFEDPLSRNQNVRINSCSPSDPGSMPPLQTSIDQDPTSSRSIPVLAVVR